MGEPVRLELTNDEALVLFEFLSRFDDSDSPTMVIEDQAEERALWRLHGMLQGSLAEIVHPDYTVLVAAARDRLRDSVE